LGTRHNTEVYQLLDHNNPAHSSPLAESEMMFSAEHVLENRGRVAIFIDGSNLFYAALQLGIEIDYTKLLCRLTGGSRLLRGSIGPTKSNRAFYSGCGAMVIA
jgi:hypothetical protein